MEFSVVSQFDRTAEGGRVSADISGIQIEQSVSLYAAGLTARDHAACDGVIF